MQEHYSATGAGQQAGAVTYFGFLSFFPVLALAVFAVGLVSHIYPDADADLASALNSVLPGLVGGDNGVQLSDIRTFSGLAGVVGLLGVLYSGLGWLSALRSALTVVFETPRGETPSFLTGKLRDLSTLVVLGTVLFVTVPLAGFVGGFSGSLLDLVGLDETLSPLITALTVVLGIAANALLFFTMFRLLAGAHVPRHSLWQGAALGAVAFEVLKQLANVLFKLTQGNAAFQAFGVALILLVWINYFSRLTLYAAAWAWTTPEARAARPVREGDPVHGPPLPSGPDAERHLATRPADTPPPWQSFAVGAGLGAAFSALVAELRRPSR